MLSLSDWANGRSVRGQADEAAELLGSAGASALQQAQAEAEAREAAGPWALVERFGYDDILDPRELRNAIIDGLHLGANRLRS